MRQLGSIEGLEPEEGMRYIIGGPSNYLKMLRRFAQRHAGDIDRLRHQLNDNALTEAQRTAHSLKGTAATLGLTAIHQSAKTLEALLRSDETVSDDHAEIAHIEAQFLQLQQGLVELAGEEERAPEPPADAELASEAQIALLRLSDLLEQNDVGAAACYQQAATVLTTVYGETAEKVGQCIARYDYDQALTLLGQILLRTPHHQQGQ